MILPATKRNILLAAFAIALIFVMINCSSSEDDNLIATEYLNLHDSVAYVGMSKCKNCHQEIYDQFIHTGMGQSFDVASKNKSAGDFSHPSLYDSTLNLSYFPYWKDDGLFVKEYRIVEGDTVHQLDEGVNYIIGSGQHTNSHIYSINGYLYQMPFTFYTQKGVWDLPPGFEKGFNSRFARKIGLECMSCHNGLPKLLEGSENKFSSIPTGIDCERCHGPGEIHVREKLAGKLIDTSKYVDFSIVNPAKLDVELQFDLCQRCHLQGNTVLAEGKSFLDFKPGMKLSDVMTVFLPRYENNDDFIMASHADRLKMSACFKGSIINADNNELKPFKNTLTCVTCHNPHISVKKSKAEWFNSKCLSCHENKSLKLCSEDHDVLELNDNNCVKCHMPVSGSIDIPHVSVHDHKIGVPQTEKEINSIRKFIGLAAVNNKKVNVRTRVRAYINQFEKFDSQPFYLDSALNILGVLPVDVKDDYFKEYVHIYYLKNQPEEVSRITFERGEETVLDSVLADEDKAYNAWTAYRIGECYSIYNKWESVEHFYKKAVELLPLNLEFQTKYAGMMVTTGRPEKAKEVFEFILSENDRYYSAWSNLGYLNELEGNLALAEKYYIKSLSLDPDYHKALFNLINLYIRQDRKNEAIERMQQEIKIHPNKTEFLRVYKALKELK